MTGKLGENIQREWDNEPFAGALWDALKALKTEPTTGRAMLAELAAQGSGLAMMYLGHSLTNSGDDTELAVGEEWLVRSAAAGSIEGRFQLSGHYERQLKREMAVTELKILAETGYAPAMYVLGLWLYQDEPDRKDVSEAVKYLRAAKSAGHLPAAALLSQIYRRENFGVSGRIVAHWLCLAKIPSAIWHVLRYPNSDRLRGITLHSVNG